VLDAYERLRQSSLRGTARTSSEDSQLRSFHHQPTGGCGRPGLPGWSRHVRRTPRTADDGEGTRFSGSATSSHTHAMRPTHGRHATLAWCQPSV